VKSELPVQRHQETDFLDGGRKAVQQFVTRLAQAGDESELVTLHVLDSAPHEVGRLLAGETGKVARVDQRHARAARRQRRRGDRAIDAADDDQHLEIFHLEAREVRVTQLHIRPS
jgi:hypothetical protein